MISVKVQGDSNKTTNSLKNMRKDVFSDFSQYGSIGVEALSRATPVDTGLAQVSWRYRIVKTGKKVGIEWYTTDIENDILVVILVQYGHATKSGGFVHGRDFINPAMRPLFDKIANDMWEKVNNA